MMHHEDTERPARALPATQVQPRSEGREDTREGNARAKTPSSQGRQDKTGHSSFMFFLLFLAWRSWRLGANSCFGSRLIPLMCEKYSQLATILREKDKPRDGREEIRRLIRVIRGSNYWPPEIDR